MTYPKSNIWQDLRATTLDVFPEGSTASYSNPVSLSKWRENGSYILTGATKKSISMSCAKTELAESLLTDVEFVLDKSTELHFYLLHAIKKDWVSPTWILVKAYYLGFFSAIGIERILGNAVFFMNRDFYKVLQKLCSPNKIETGTGTFTLSKDADLSAMHCSISLEKSGDGFHETVWENLFKKFSILVSNHQSIADQNEIRLYKALLGNNSYKRMKWLSEFRNRVNYRTDSDLSEIRKSRFSEFKTIVQISSELNLADKVNRIERLLLGSCEPNLEKPENISTSYQIVTMTSFLLKEILEEIYSDLASRRRLDKRWGLRREKFIQKVRSQAAIRG